MELFGRYTKRNKCGKAVANNVYRQQILDRLCFIEEEAERDFAESSKFPPGFIPEVRKVKRAAKVGEWVRVTKVYYADHRRLGDVIQCVKSVERLRGNQFKHGSQFWKNQDYVVLENYPPPSVPENPEPPKWNWEGFVNQKISVKCNCERDMDMFMAYLQGKGLKWASDKPPTNYSCEADSVIICWGNSITFGELRNNPIPIVTFSKSTLTSEA